MVHYSNDVAVMQLKKDHWEEAESTSSTTQEDTDDGSDAIADLIANDNPYAKAFLQ